MATLLPSKVQDLTSMYTGPLSSSTTKSKRLRPWRTSAPTIQACAKDGTASATMRELAMLLVRWVWRKIGLPFSSMTATTVNRVFLLPRIDGWLGVM